VSQSLKQKISELVSKANSLYNYYVPSFTYLRIQVDSKTITDIVNNQIRAVSPSVYWLPLDNAYYTTTKEDFYKIIGWDWTDTRRYLYDMFDCDKFAMYFKARTAINFGINAIGVVIDYASGHAYNLVILREGSDYKWYLFEPQNDKLFTYENRNQYLYAFRNAVLLL